MNTFPDVVVRLANPRTAPPAPGVLRTTAPTSHWVCGLEAFGRPRGLHPARLGHRFPKCLSAQKDRLDPSRTGFGTTKAGTRLALHASRTMRQLWQVYRSSNLARHTRDPRPFRSSQRRRVRCHRWWDGSADRGNGQAALGGPCATRAAPCVTAQFSVAHEAPLSRGTTIPRGSRWRGLMPRPRDRGRWPPGFLRSRWAAASGSCRR